MRDGILDLCFPGHDGTGRGKKNKTQTGNTRHREWLNPCPAVRADVPSQSWLKSQRFLPEPPRCCFTPAELLTSSQFLLFLLAIRSSQAATHAPWLPSVTDFSVVLVKWDVCISPFTYNSGDQEVIAQRWGGGGGAPESLKPIGALPMPPPHPSRTFSNSGPACLLGSCPVS